MPRDKELDREKMQFDDPLLQARYDALFLLGRPASDYPLDVTKLSDLRKLCYVQGDQIVRPFANEMYDLDDGTPEMDAYKKQVMADFLNRIGNGSVFMISDEKLKEKPQLLQMMKGPSGRPEISHYKQPKLVERPTERPSTWARFAHWITRGRYHKEVGVYDQQMAKYNQQAALREEIANRDVVIQQTAAQLAMDAADEDLAPEEISQIGTLRDRQPVVPTKEQKALQHSLEKLDSFALQREKQQTIYGFSRPDPALTSPAIQKVLDYNPNIAQQDFELKKVQHLDGKETYSCGISPETATVITHMALLSNDLVDRLNKPELNVGQKRALMVIHSIDDVTSNRDIQGVMPGELLTDAHAMGRTIIQARQNGNMEPLAKLIGQTAPVMLHNVLNSVSGITPTVLAKMEEVNRLFDMMLTPEDVARDDDQPLPLANAAAQHGFTEKDWQAMHAVRNILNYTVKGEQAKVRLYGGEELTPEERRSLTKDVLVAQAINTKIIKISKTTEARDQQYLMDTISREGPQVAQQAQTVAATLYARDPYAPEILELMDEQGMKKLADQVENGEVMRQMDEAEKQGISYEKSLIDRVDKFDNDLTNAGKLMSPVVPKVPAPKAPAAQMEHQPSAQLLEAQRRVQEQHQNQQEPKVLSKTSMKK